MYYRISSCVNVTTDHESYLAMPSVDLSPVLRTLAGRTANIDINKSIAPDIPFRRCGKNARLWWRKQSRPDAKVTGIFHDSSLVLYFASSPSVTLLAAPRCCSTRVYCTEITSAGDLTTLIENSLCFIQARTNELAQPSEMFGSTVWPAEILPCPDNPLPSSNLCRDLFVTLTLVLV